MDIYGQLMVTDTTNDLLYFLDTNNNYQEYRHLGRPGATGKAAGTAETAVAAAIDRSHCAWSLPLRLFGRAAAGFGAEMLEKILGQDEYIVAAVFQWRQVKRDDAQAEEKVFAEAALPH